MQRLTKCAVVAGVLTCAATMVPAAPGHSQGPSAKVPSLADSPLSKYYHDMLASFQSQGLMKPDRNVSNAPMDPALLSRDFLEIAMFNEYGSGLSTSGSRKAKPLLRWEQPVRMQVMFGASMDKSKRAKDLREISNYVNTLARATRHPITVNPHKPNFHVLVVSEGERKSLAKKLPKLIPGVSQSTIKSISRMRPNHLCMVIAEPHADRSRGFKSAVAVIRAEHPDAMRASCIHEELAQGLGLSNDCQEVWPSIFNDDQEYALLTRRDERLLGMLYDPRLKSGMTLKDVQPYLHAVASSQF